MNFFKTNFWKTTLYLTILSLLSISFLSGCGKSESNNQNNKTTEKNYDLFIFNGDKNIASEFSKLCDAYSNKTGTVIKCVTPRADEDTMEILDNYMNTTAQPGIFSVTDLDELKKWQEAGKIFDFSNASDNNFKEIANKIPNVLRLSSNNVDNTGIPYTVEAYGLIVDPKMFSSLFGGEYHRAILRDLENCTFDEFESFVNAVSLYITENRIYEFQLCNHNYSTLNKKSGLSENLNGVFAGNYGDTNSVTDLFNIFLNRIFTSSAYLSNASSDEISGLRPSLKNFFKMLDVLTTCVSGKTSTIYRGTELVDTKAMSKSQAIKNFVAGNSLFLIGSTNDFQTISILDPDLANRLDFIPIKCSQKKLISDETNSTSVTDETETITETSEEKKLNASLAIKVPRYFSINSTVDEKEILNAEKFLTWLKTSDLANDYIVNKFGYVPYDTIDSGKIRNTLSQSMLDYIKSTKILPFVAEGLDKKFRTETLPNYVIKNCLNDPIWETFNYDEFSENILKLWKNPA